MAAEDAGKVSNTSEEERGPYRRTGHSLYRNDRKLRVRLYTLPQLSAARTARRCARHQSSSADIREMLFAIKGQCHLANLRG